MNILRGVARWPLPPGVGSEGLDVHFGVRPTDLVLGDEVQSMVLVMHGRTDARSYDIVHLALETSKAHVIGGSSGLRLG